MNIEDFLVAPTEIKPTIKRNKIEHIVHDNDDQEWRLNGLLHNSKDEPAIIHANGDKYWYKKGKRHRDNDNPAIVHFNGDLYWYKNDKCTRDGDKPAIMYANGDVIWVLNDKKHRDNNLPAVILANGVCEWWVDGVHIKSVQCTEEKIAQYIRPFDKEINENLDKSMMADFAKQ